jgi:hypothetical protein
VPMRSYGSCQRSWVDRRKGLTMSVQEWQGAMRRIFGRMLELEGKAQDSGLTGPERAEYDELADRGHRLLDPSAIPGGADEGGTPRN